MKKAFKFVLFVIAIAILTSSCGSKNAYRSDVACSEITDVIEKEMAAEGGYARYGDNELKYLLGDDVSLSTDHSVMYSLLSENIDEFGIFKAENEKDARKLADECEDHLEEKYEDENAFISSYAPEELPKLKNAEVKIFGNYVTFAILDESDRAAFFDKIEQTLKK